VWSVNGEDEENMKTEVFLSEFLDGRGQKKVDTRASREIQTRRSTL
jgi:hypothetical protein